MPVAVLPARRTFARNFMHVHLPGRKRKALHTSSIETWRTPWIRCLSRCLQRMSRFRSVSSCPALGYAIQASRSSLAAFTTGPHVASTSASVLTKTRMAPALADVVTTTSSRFTPGGFSTTRTFIPSFRFIFSARLIRCSPRRSSAGSGLTFPLPPVAKSRSYKYPLRWLSRFLKARNFKFHRPVPRTADESHGRQTHQGNRCGLRPGHQRETLRHRGFLGGVVRAVSRDRPDRRRAREEVRGQGHVREIEHGREPGGPAAIHGHGHPDAPLLQRREARRPSRRCDAASAFRGTCQKASGVTTVRNTVRFLGGVDGQSDRDARKQEEGPGPAGRSANGPSGRAQRA